MANISRIKVDWSGTAVTGAGLTTFYSNDVTPTALPGAVLTFFDDLKAIVPAGVTWTIPSSGDLLDEADGELQGGWTASGGGAVSSTGTAVHAQGVGLRIKWVTGGVVAGRRVRGSTFIVPVVTDNLQADGTFRTNEINVMGAAALALLAADPTLVIWSRPAPGRSGTSHLITSVATPDAISWLRSRRV